MDVNVSVMMNEDSLTRSAHTSRVRKSDVDNAKDVPIHNGTHTDEKGRRLLRKDLGVDKPGQRARSNAAGMYRSVAYQGTGPRPSAKNEKYAITTAHGTADISVCFGTMQAHQHTCNLRACRDRAQQTGKHTSTLTAGPPNRVSAPYLQGRRQGTQSPSQHNSLPFPRRTAAGRIVALSCP